MQIEGFAKNANDDPNQRLRMVVVDNAINP